MEAGDVPGQVVEAVAAGFAGAVQVDAVEPLHDVHVIGHLKIRHLRLAEALNLDVLAVVFADGHGIVDDVRDHQHALADLRLELRFLLFQGVQLLGDAGDFLAYLHRLVLLALAHQRADLLGQDVALVAQGIAALQGVAVFLVQGDDLVHHGQLLVLEFLADVFLDFFRVGPDQVDVQHVPSRSPLLLESVGKKISLPIHFAGTRSSRCHPVCPVSRAA